MKFKIFNLNKLKITNGIHKSYVERIKVFPTRHMKIIKRLIVTETLFPLR